MTAPTFLNVSVWRTLKLCCPLVSPVAENGDTHAAHGLESMRHSKAPEASPVNATESALEVVVDAGGVGIFGASGGVASTVHEAAAAELAEPLLATCRTRKLCAPSANLLNEIGLVHFAQAEPSVEH